jgi:hypothetical protein
MMWAFLVSGRLVQLQWHQQDCKIECRFDGVVGMESG